MIVKGFRFGMILQLAIGPVSVYVFQTVIKYGFSKGFESVLGVVFADALFILLAILGLGTILKKSEKRKKLLNTAGSIIMLFFGVSMILAVFGTSLMPNFLSANYFEQKNVFLMSMLLTSSNPLTILFWAGVFSNKVANENLSEKEVYYFGLGAVLATLFFLTFIAFVGSVFGIFISDDIIKILNVVIGLFIMYVSIRSLFSFQKTDSKER